MTIEDKLRDQERRSTDSKINQLSIKISDSNTAPQRVVNNDMMPFSNPKTNPSKRIKEDKPIFSGGKEVKSPSHLKLLEQLKSVNLMEIIEGQQTKHPELNALSKEQL